MFLVRKNYFSFEVVTCPLNIQLNKYVSRKNQNINFSPSTKYSTNFLQTGFVFFENSTLEIKPLNERLQNLYAIQEPANEWPDLNEKVPHIIRQTAPLEPDVCNYIEDPLLAVKEKSDGVREDTKLESLTLELSLFFDESAYKIFGPYMDYNYEKIQNMLLAYLNGVRKCNDKQ